MSCVFVYLCICVCVQMCLCQPSCIAIQSDVVFNIASVIWVLFAWAIRCCGLRRCYTAKIELVNFFRTSLPCLPFRPTNKQQTHYVCICMYDMNDWMARLMSEVPFEQRSFMGDFVMISAFVCRKWSDGLPSVDDFAGCLHIKLQRTRSRCGALFDIYYLLAVWIACAKCEFSALLYGFERPVSADFPVFALFCNGPDSTVFHSLTLSLSIHLFLVLPVSPLSFLRFPSIRRECVAMIDGEDTFIFAF